MSSSFTNRSPSSVLETYSASNTRSLDDGGFFLLLSDQTVGHRVIRGGSLPITPVARLTFIDSNPPRPLRSWHAIYNNTIAHSLSNWSNLSDTSLNRLRYHWSRVFSKNFVSAAATSGTSMSPSYMRDKASGTWCNAPDARSRNRIQEVQTNRPS